MDNATNLISLPLLHAKYAFLPIAVPTINTSWTYLLKTKHNNRFTISAINCWNTHSYTICLWHKPSGTLPIRRVVKNTLFQISGESSLLKLFCKMYACTYVCIISLFVCLSVPTWTKLQILKAACMWEIKAREIIPYYYCRQKSVGLRRKIRGGLKYEQSKF